MVDVGADSGPFITGANIQQRIYVRLQANFAATRSGRGGRPPLWRVTGQAALISV